MIDRKRTQYVSLYVNHKIPSIVQWDPKVSVLLWLERRQLRVKDAPNLWTFWNFRLLRPQATGLRVAVCHVCVLCQNE